MFALHNGEERAGADLAALIEKARAVRAALDGFPRHYPRFVLEQAAIAGALNPDILADKKMAAEAANYIAKRLDMLSDETERGWKGEATPDGGLKFAREVRGVKEAVAIDGALISSADARKLDRLAPELQTAYLKNGTLRRKDETREVRAPTQLLDAIFAWGRQGMALQRYKGLGEMNPNQLWETTLDENARTLLQVKVEHADRGGRSVRQTDGRHRRAAPRIHSGQRAQRGEFGRVSQLTMAGLDPAIQSKTRRLLARVRAHAGWPPQGRPW